MFASPNRTVLEALKYPNTGLSMTRSNICMSPEASERAAPIENLFVLSDISIRGAAIFKIKFLAYKLPAIPAPPATARAPVLTEFDEVVLMITTLSLEEYRC